MNLSIVHDKAAKTISISVPGYIAKVLERFHEWAGTRTVSTPAIYTAPNYGAKVQIAMDDDSAPLSATDTTTLQAISGSHLYYACAVNPTMLPAVNAVASQQVIPTERIRAQVVRLLQYARANSSNQVVFHRSKMHFVLQVDASYLSRSKGRSVAGGVEYFGDSNNPTHENVMVYVLSSIIGVVVASAGEAEYASAFQNAQQAVHFRHIAMAMGHPQPATPILCDNAFAIGVATDTIKQKRSKSIDMRFHWLRDRIRQEPFRMIHRSGRLIPADFFTKPLPVPIHQKCVWRLVHTPDRSPCTFTAWRRVSYRRGRLTPTPLPD